MFAVNACGRLVTWQKLHSTLMRVICIDTRSFNRARAVQDLLSVFEKCSPGRRNVTQLELSVRVGLVAW